ELALPIFFPKLRRCISPQQIFRISISRQFASPPLLTSEPLEISRSQSLEYPASGGRMLGKETPLTTPQRKLWHIVILVAVCTVLAAPSGADDVASGKSEEHTSELQSLR